SPEGGFVGEIPQLKGCLAQAETEKDCLDELEIVKKLWLETALANQIPVPDTNNFIERLRQAVNA
ncbi:MAG TPA: type II toxin-antitoxin system HicB family antitoxin, partial [Candidatus Kapabacteria bacterium]|nr:type II toxin-antitoxin system HicB family antitoxin [Candidatus Kapabacteria bacterium]